MRKLSYVVCLVVVGVATLLGQVRLQPTPPPSATADSEPWFQLGEAIGFGGSQYHPAGPRVYFDGNVMVLVGSYRGVPLYMNTTVEPYSVLLVPVGGQMQPFERRRTGDLAGTTGSRAPSFPVVQATGTSGTDFGPAQQPGPPTAATPAPRAATPPEPPAPVGTILREQAAAVPAPAVPSPVEVPRPVGMAGAAPPRDTSRPEVPPEQQGIFITFDGSRWKAGGRAVAFSADRFRQVGSYQGFPVYAERTEPLPLVVYLRGRGDVVAPYARVD